MAGDRYRSRHPSRLDPLALTVENGFAGGQDLAVPEDRLRAYTEAFPEELNRFPIARTWSEAEKSFAARAALRYAECMHFAETLDHEHKSWRTGERGSPNKQYLDQREAVDSTTALFHVHTHRALLAELRSLAHADPAQFPHLHVSDTGGGERGLMRFLGTIIGASLKAAEATTGSEFTIYPLKQAIDYERPEESLNFFEKRYSHALRDWQR